MRRGQQLSRKGPQAVSKQEGWQQHESPLPFLMSLRVQMTLLMLLEPDHTTGHRPAEAAMAHRGLGIKLLYIRIPVFLLLTPNLHTAPPHYLFLLSLRGGGGATTSSSSPSVVSSSTSDPSSNTRRARYSSARSPLPPRLSKKGGRGGVTGKVRAASAEPERAALGLTQKVHKDQKASLRVWMGVALETPVGTQHL